MKKALTNKEMLKRSDEAIAIGDKFKDVLSKEIAATDQWMVEKWWGKLSIEMVGIIIGKKKLANFETLEAAADGLINKINEDHQLSITSPWASMVASAASSSTPAPKVKPTQTLESNR